MLFLEFFITAIVFYICGYVSGYMNGKRMDAKEATDTLRTGIRQVVHDQMKAQIKTGVIPSPTREQIRLRNLPQKEREGIEAMRETLANSPEIQEHKRLVEKFKKSAVGIFK